MLILKKVLLKYRFGIALVIGLSIGFISARSTYSYVADKKWAGSSAKYGFASNVPGGAWRDRAINAVNAWNNVSTSSWTWTYSSIDADGEVAYENVDGLGGTLGITYTGPRCTNNSVCTFNIYVDNSEPWYTGISSPTTSQLDLQSNLTHEFGHAAWANHTNLTCTANSGPTMCGDLFKGTTHQRTLEQDDRDGITSKYP